MLCAGLQNNVLWWNDPDCVVLTGNLPDNEFQFHATTVYATGGMLLSGDDLTKIAPARLAMLRKLAPPTGVPAAFEDREMKVGVIRLKDRLAVCLLNWTDGPQDFAFELPHAARVHDFWTGQDLGRREGTFAVKGVLGRSARLLVCVPERK